ncbi:hypothetical protein [Streptomyces sp. NPDC101776]|uniref:hypothetical protein n=1 Tax=Streptomyces sp. NPDC101776 TaxID=3366146 RepID=UPI003818D4C1
MPRMLRMPGKDVLPPGPKRELVAELYVYYREAGRPPLPHIETLTQKMPNPHKVSRETIRRLLTGQTTSQWAVVDALVRALCELQARAPDDRRWPEPDDQYEEDNPETCREYLRRLWNDDIDGLEPGEAPTVPPAVSALPTSGGWGGTPPASTGGWGNAPSQPKQDDPWATGTPPQLSQQTRGYSDEPPF